MEKNIQIVFISFFLALLASGRTYSSDVRIIFNCSPAAECSALEKNLPSNIVLKKGVREFIEGHFSIFSRKMESLRFVLNEESLQIFVKLRTNISQINFKGVDFADLDMLRSLINSKLDNSYSSNDDETIKNELSNYLEENGWRNFNIEVELQQENTLLVSVIGGERIIVDNVSISIGNAAVSDFRALKKIVGQHLNLLNLKILTSEVSSELFREGYFFNNINFDVKIIDDKASLAFNIDLGKRIILYFETIEFANRNELNEIAWSIMRSDTGASAVNRIKEEIENLYFTKGRFDTEVKIAKNLGKSKNGEEVEVYYFSVKIGNRVKISEVIYEGANEQVLKGLNLKRKDELTALASRGFFDPVFYASHRGMILNYLVSQGYLDASVKGPFLDRIKSTITYKISTGNLYQIRNVLIRDNKGNIITDKEIGDLNRLTGSPYNKKVVDGLVASLVLNYQNQGFFYCEVKTESESFAKFEGQNVDIDIVIDKGKLTIFGGLSLSGLQETKSVVVSREININENDYLTPEKIKEINENLLNLGLFNYVRISPYIETENSDSYIAKISIQVQEKDRKIVRVTPGYRTDIGYKIGGSYQYNNLKGMNETMTISGIVNRRTSFSNLDARRKVLNQEMIEGSFNADYELPYLGSNKIKLSNSLEASRRRFFGFDADIFRAGVKTSKDLTKNFSISALYQLEVIRQYNATNSIDEGYFRIGGITPSLIYDYRDSLVNPKKGGISSILFEYARPEFLMSNLKDDPEINFYKLIVRQVLYKTFGPVTFASSFTMGMQENLSKDAVIDSNGNQVVDSQGRSVTQGYIPNIKVFRLEGINTVRGFADNEINRLTNGFDISQVAIRNKAYLTNFKLETRYALQDNLVWTLFVDAGRVSVDQYDFKNLRTSAGTGIKFLTPVGTLDFDYGIKLNREYDALSRRESLGRFHLSIGFF